MAEFKTSFIPKKPLTKTIEKKPRQGVNLILFISLIFFFSTLLVAGGVFVYQVLIDRQEKGLVASVKRAERAVEPELVESLKRIDTRINASRGIIDNHIAVSAVFNLLEQLTLESIAFDSFSYLVEPDGKITLKLSGVSRDYSSVALQSVIFGENRFIEDPIFSNLHLDNEGNVIFNFSTNINRRLILYKNIFSDLGA